MPVLSGIEVCRHIKRDPETRLVPVVLITGLTATQDRLAGIDAGATGATRGAQARDRPAGSCARLRTGGSNRQRRPGDPGLVLLVKVSKPCAESRVQLGIDGESGVCTEPSRWQKLLLVCASDRVQAIATSVSR